MGFFDALFGGKKKRSQVDVVPDHIWMTIDAKFAGLAKEAEERSTSETAAIVLVGHFPDVLSRIEKLVHERNWGVPCKAVLASKLDTNLAASLELDESARLDLFICERHPLPSQDARIEAFAEALPCRCRLSRHVSLEDPVMEVFAGDWARDVLKQLGMKEDEAIESPIVSRRISQAQKKIEDRASGKFHAHSAAEWLEKNCPELGS